MYVGKMIRANAGAGRRFPLAEIGIAAVPGLAARDDFHRHLIEEPDLRGRLDP